jgi:hypothetical protein
MPDVTLTLTEREQEVLGFALMKTMRLARAHADDAKGRGDAALLADYRHKANELRDLISKLDRAPMVQPTTWSDHDRNIPMDELDEAEAGLHAELDAADAADAEAARIVKGGAL